MKQELPDSELLFNAVNEQGYLFQEACERVLRSNQTNWEVIASEYPVSHNDVDRRIDIVLRAKSPSSYLALWALLECKRAHPKEVAWLFGTPELPPGDAHCSTLGLEYRNKNHTPRRLERLHFNVTTYAVKWWLEVKKRGSQNKGSTPDNIERAFQQVLQGVGLFAREQLERSNKAITNDTASFIPVVITTAPLYVANYRPEDVDLNTGMVAKDKINFGDQGQPPKKVNCVLVDYGIGEDVGWGSVIPANDNVADPAELQKKYKMRSIFVVNSASILPFFSSLSLAAQS